MRRDRVIAVGFMLPVLAVMEGDVLMGGAIPTEHRDEHSLLPLEQVAGPEYGAIRDIEVARGRLWLATRGGLAVHTREGGQLLFTLTEADGLAGDVVWVAEVVGGEHLLVGGERGAVVLSNLGGVAPSDAGALANIAVHPVGGLNPAGERDPVVAAFAGRGRLWVLSQARGIHEVTHGSDGSWHADPEPSSLLGWSAAVATENGVVLGGLDGTVASFGLPLRDRYADFDDGSDHRRSLGAPVLSMATGSQAVAVATGESLLFLADDGHREIRDSRAGALLATALGGDARLLLVGTADGRLLSLAGEPPVLLARAPRRITALCRDGDRVWVGVWRRGLYQLALAPSPAVATYDGHGSI